LDVRCHFVNTLDRARAILRMPHALADVKRFDFHDGKLTTDGHGL
jgi:hypothetical protein